MTASRAALISNLFEIFLGVTGFFYLLVIVFLVWAIVRRRHGDSREPMLRRSLVVWVGIVAFTLGGLSIATWLTDRSLARAADRPGLKITLIGHQYWWEVRYDNGDSQQDHPHRQRAPSAGRRARDHQPASDRRDPQPLDPQPQPARRT